MKAQYVKVAGKWKRVLGTYVKRINTFKRAYASYIKVADVYKDAASLNFGGTFSVLVREKAYPDNQPPYTTWAAAANGSNINFATSDIKRAAGSEGDPRLVVGDILCYPEYGGEKPPFPPGYPVFQPLTYKLIFSAYDVTGYKGVRDVDIAKVEAARFPTTMTITLGGTNFVMNKTTASSGIMMYDVSSGQRTAWYNKITAIKNSWQTLVVPEIVSDFNP